MYGIALFEVWGDLSDLAHKRTAPSPQKSSFWKVQIQLKRLFSPKDFESFILSAGTYLHLSECGKPL